MRLIEYKLFFFYHIWHELASIVFLTHRTKTIFGNDARVTRALRQRYNKTLLYDTSDDKLWKQPVLIKPYRTIITYKRQYVSIITGP